MAIPMQGEPFPASDICQKHQGQQAIIAGDYHPNGDGVLTLTLTSHFSSAHKNQLSSYRSLCLANTPNYIQTNGAGITNTTERAELAAMVATPFLLSHTDRHTLPSFSQIRNKHCIQSFEVTMRVLGGPFLAFSLHSWGQFVSGQLCRFSTVGLVALPALASSGQRPPELSKRAARYSFAMPFSFPSHTHQGFPQLSFRRSKDAGHAAYFRRISRGQAGKGDFPPIAPTLLCAPPVEPSTQRHVIAFAAQAVNRSVVRPSIRVQAQRAG
eukprot:1137859-Pelagomonas_calceolata.AAC.1